jgi:DNA-binding CsgD family transcriptional regulator
MSNPLGHFRIMRFKAHRGVLFMTASARITDETFSDLVGRIYQAACDPTRWPDFLHAFAQAVGGRGTLLYAHNFDTRDASTGAQGAFPTAVIDFDPHFLNTLEEHYNHVNVWAQNESLLEPGRPVTGSMLYPESKLPSTEFYQDWLRPQDYFHAIGGIVVRDGPWAMKFSSLRSRRAGDFNSEEMQLYQALLPHLARAAHIQRRFEFLQCLSTSSLAVLDTVPAAVMLLDTSGHALHGNATAHAELRRADPLKLGSSGEICVRGGPRAQAAVRTAICAALDPARGVKEGLPNVAQVSRRNGEKLSVQTLPLPQCSRATSATLIRRRLAACALVVHALASRIPTVGVQLLRHVYGLTPAEVRVALAIADGETIQHYAERRRVSRNTVASQLKRVFDKTGLRRQSELVRWLLLSGATLRPGIARY